MLDTLSAEFPRERIDANRRAIWSAALGGITYGDAIAAAIDHLADPDRGQFFPKPADIIRRVGTAHPGPAPLAEPSEEKRPAFVYRVFDLERDGYVKLAAAVPLDSDRGRQLLRDSIAALNAAGDRDRERAAATVAG